MKVDKFTAEGFRNIKRLELAPCDGINVIYGENAQGKTNILEGIRFFSSGRSFRGAKDRELIGFENEYASLVLDFYAKKRSQTARGIISDKKVFFLNGVELPGTGALTGEFNTVIFSPEHLSLIKDGPAERRSFTDSAICPLHPKYADCLKRYKTALVQRNAVITDMPSHPELCSMLELYEEQLAVYGAYIIKKRIDYLSILCDYAREIYSGISSGKEVFDAVYVSEAVKDRGMTQSDITESLKEKLLSVRQEDMLRGVTSAGPHRDDIYVSVNGKSARMYGSQGQQRSCSLALKLGEADVLNRFTGEYPVTLLDDVMSELDTERQNYILERISAGQVFITCCEPTERLKNTDGGVFCIKNGELV